MATLALKDCRELMIFRAFTGNTRFLDACKAIREFDRAHPEKKILEKPSDKHILKKCFSECRRAIDIAFPRAETPDFTDESCLNRLRNVFNQQLPSGCRKSYDDFSSSISGQIGMGKIFSDHMDYIRRAGVSYYSQLTREKQREDEQFEHEQATVNSYRRLKQGYDDGKVFSGKKTYQSNRESLWSRMCGGDGR